MPVLTFAERNAEICTRYQSGDTIPKLAQRYDLTPQRIHEILRRGLRRLRSTHKPIDVAAAYALYRDDLSLTTAEIAALYGLTAQGLAKKFDKYGLPCARRDRMGGGAWRKKAPADPLLAERYALYLDGLTMSEVAELCDTYPSVVSRAFTRAELPTLGMEWRRASQDERRAELDRVTSEGSDDDGATGSADATPTH
jgi:hypothetical protein